jgi:hypothetical protein
MLVELVIPTNCHILFVSFGKCVFGNGLLAPGCPGLRIRIFNLLIKLLTCLLYIGRVIFDNDPTQATW